MSNYNPIRDLAPKDLLETGDPDKLILGAELQEEHDAIAVAIATKFDASDIATEAQAKALVSNEVLITPLRLSQALSGQGGVGLALVSLNAPGEDALLYWDDSLGEFVWITLGSGLTLTGGDLTIDPTVLDITTLAGDPNLIVDHSTVTITGEEGVKGGGDITASRVLSLDIPGLDSLPALDDDDDMLVVWDESEAEHKKTPVTAFRGEPLGELQALLGTAASLAASTYVTMLATPVYDGLERGSYDPATGLYTAGASGARVLVMGTLRINALPKGSGGQMRLEVRGPGGTVVDFQQHRNDADSTSSTYTLKAAGVIALNAGETASVHMWCSGANTAAGGAGGSNLSIVELG